ncbi:anti-sigma factor [Tenacibaculum sp. ZS6-P6]|uniref:anti-sigma factor n=1 Tax=Tenacibaculum sp. ZS6-P6 TaxID=3447503 RepID=UPI003F953BA2
MKKLILGALALAFTLTFTGCNDDEDVTITEAGTLTGGPFSFLVDGIADNVSGISVGGNTVGTNTSFIITDEAGMILGLPGDIAALEGVNFDGAGAGKCFIWFIAYENGLEGLEMGKNANNLSGNYDLSNNIEVDRIQGASLSLNFTGLENLGNDYKYEGWIIVNGAPVTTGVFTVDDSGTLSQTEFYVKKSDLDAATAFVLSIEPAVDPDPAPAATKLLSGDFSGSSANVTSTGVVADFSGSTGKYILATPTDTDDTNEYSGIWFLDNSGMSPVAGLNLPTLPAGWKYEGWVVINGTPISTGTFTDVSNADDNAATSPFKGTSNNGPSYPGEDYVMGSVGSITFPIDLRGNTVVISVEPSPDNSSAPFTLKPLAQGIPAMAMDHSVLNIGAGPVQVISGTVTR